jgi:hypothetical protein
MRIFLALAGVMLIGAGPPPADPSLAKAKPDADKMICHSEKIVGSNLSERVCRTKSDWDAARFNDQHTLDQRNGQLRAPPLKNGGG